eukprot:scaffold109546_cov46-Cyclotella_meneghiniana.AAC.1
MKVQAIAVLAAVSAATASPSSYSHPVVRKGSAAHTYRQSANIHRTLQEKEVPPPPEIPGVEEPPLKEGEEPPIKEGDDEPPMKEGDGELVPPPMKEGEDESPMKEGDGEPGVEPVPPPIKETDEDVEDGELVVDGILFQPEPEEATVDVVETTIAPMDEMVQDEMSMVTMVETTVAAEIIKDEMSMPEFEMSIETDYDNVDAGVDESYDYEPVEDNLVDEEETANTTEVVEEEPTDDKFSFAVEAALEEGSSVNGIIYGGMYRVKIVSQPKISNNTDSYVRIGAAFEGATHPFY